jgi:Vitamin B12 dependent methionine synthase, activation domain
MRQIIRIPVERIMPDPGGVFQSQGIPPGTSPPERVKVLYDSAVELFIQLAAPIGIMADISIEDFAVVYSGTGMNEMDTPLDHIFPRAHQLALFAFTLGENTSREIQQLLENKNLALGYMLDAVASYCADKAADAAQALFQKHLREAGQAEESSHVLLYSPGYCGWHISGQKTLFEYLEPEEIGIHLNERFLMVPLKSISGVLVAGKAGIHRFSNNYPFCVHCRTRTCRVRIKSTTGG